MASNTCKLLCLVLFFAFVNKGYGDCSLHGLLVRQSKTGRMVQNKPEWEVTVTNPCIKCRFQYTKLSCVGFQSVTPVPTSSFKKEGDLCLVNAGKFLYPQVDFKFNYVWDTSFDLHAMDGVIVCY